MLILAVYFCHQWDPFKNSYIDLVVDSVEWYSSMLGGVSPHLTDSWNNFLWYLIFETEIILTIMWHSLSYKLHDCITSIISSHHLLSNTNYTEDLALYTISKITKIHFGAFNKCNETSHWSLFMWRILLKKININLAYLNSKYNFVSFKSM